MEHNMEIKKPMKLKGDMIPVPVIRPPARKAATVSSITRMEIDLYWKRKRMTEEEHLLAAQKAAARIRARFLQEEDYRSFEELVMEIIKEGKESGMEAEENDAMTKERRVGIKDWWTKSNYAYLNQPAITSILETGKKRTSTYTPQKICSSYFLPAHQLNSPASFGIF